MCGKKPTALAATAGECPTGGAGQVDSEFPYMVRLRPPLAGGRVELGESERCVCVHDGEAREGVGNRRFLTESPSGNAASSGCAVRTGACTGIGDLGERVGNAIRKDRGSTLGFRKGLVPSRGSVGQSPRQAANTVMCWNMCGQAQRQVATGSTRQSLGSQTTHKGERPQPKPTYNEQRPLLESP